RWYRRFHANEGAEGPGNQQRRLWNEKRQRRIDAVVATEKIVAELMRRQDREQRSRKKQSLRKKVRVQKCVLVNSKDRGQIQPLQHEKLSGNTANPGGRGGTQIHIRP